MAFWKEAKHSRLSNTEFQKPGKGGAQGGCRFVPGPLTGRRAGRLPARPGPLTGLASLCAGAPCVPRRGGRVPETLVALRRALPAPEALLRLRQARHQQGAVRARPLVGRAPEVLRRHLRQGQGARELLPEAQGEGGRHRLAARPGGARARGGGGQTGPAPREGGRGSPPPPRDSVVRKQEAERRSERGPRLGEQCPERPSSRRPFLPAPSRWPLATRLPTGRVGEGCDARAPAAPLSLPGRFRGRAGQRSSGRCSHCCRSWDTVM